jgi:lipopolysaccharide/colanic/teichoic acid biosynthesis glycosyltransferase
MIKRFLDIIFSTISILVLSPLLIPIVIILKLTGEGYIFYKQERIGQNGDNTNIEIVENIMSKNRFIITFCHQGIYWSRNG